MNDSQPAPTHLFNRIAELEAALATQTELHQAEKERAAVYLGQIVVWQERAFKAEQRADQLAATLGSRRPGSPGPSWPQQVEARLAAIEQVQRRMEEAAPA